MSDKTRPAAADARTLPRGDAPLREGDRVIVRLRANWEFESRVLSVNDGAVRDGAVPIFDRAVRDVLQFHAEDIVLIRKTEDAP